MEVHVGAVEWGAAARPALSGSPPGDGWLALSWGPYVLLAAFDALGHGRDAAAAAAVAGRELARDPDAPIESLIARCDLGLRHTRGVALAVARIEVPSATMTWAGVGNVHGLVLRANPDARPRRLSLVQRAGVVGRRLPALTCESVALEPGDLVVFATDGIAPDFADEAAFVGPPQRVAERLLDRHFLGSDDGLVLAAGFRAGRP